MCEVINLGYKYTPPITQTTQEDRQPLSLKWYHEFIFIDTPKHNRPLRQPPCLKWYLKWYETMKNWESQLLHKRSQPMHLSLKNIQNTSQIQTSAARNRFVSHSFILLQHYYIAVVIQICWNIHRVANNQYWDKTKLAIYISRQCKMSMRITSTY